MIHWRNFSESGRHLHTLVTIGPDAAPETENGGLADLDGLRLDPDYKPSWRSSG